MWRLGTVVAVRDETPTARSIRLEVADWPGHISGQHVDVRLTASDEYSAVRSYSIASAPNPQRRVELSVERLPNGEVSPYLARELRVGDQLELRGPIGGWFIWRPQQTEPIQLIAGVRASFPDVHDSLAPVGRRHRAVSIVVFGARTRSGLVPR
jgi:ferredoxin-NADP reductase